jgi:hypothetical protein
MTAAAMTWNRIALEPDGSGVTDEARTASRMPTKPANRAHITKLPVSTRRVLTPASAAASRLPPTATV